MFGSKKKQLKEDNALLLQLLSITEDDLHEAESVRRNGARLNALNHYWLDVLKPVSDELDGMVARG